MNLKTNGGTGGDDEDDDKSDSTLKETWHGREGNRVRMRHRLRVVVTPAVQLVAEGFPRESLQDQLGWIRPSSA